MSEFEVRVANPSDYQKVKRLCIRAVGEDDYAIPKLRRIISRKGLFLAFKDSHLVGMSNLSKTLDGAGWFGMARTDPDWRRKGVAISLQRAKANYARSLGIGRVRLFVLSTNTPSLRACLKGGFTPVCNAAHLSLRLHRIKKPGAIVSSKLSVPRSLTYPSKMNGYMGYEETFVKTDRGVLAKIAGQNEIYSNEDLSFVLGRPDEFESEIHREFSMLSGSFEAGLRSVISTCFKLRSRTIGTFIPYESYLIRSARKLGFLDDHWGWHCICLEKKI